MSNSVTTTVSKPVFTIAEFCDTHHISRTHLHNLTKAGRGPRMARVGRRVLISAAAASDWLVQLEQNPITDSAIA